MTRRRGVFYRARCLVRRVDRACCWCIGLSPALLPFLPAHRS